MARSGKSEVNYRLPRADREQVQRFLGAAWGMGRDSDDPISATYFSAMAAQPDQPRGTAGRRASGRQHVRRDEELRLAATIGSLERYRARLHREYKRAIDGLLDLVEARQAEAEAYAEHAIGQNEPDAAVASMPAAAPAAPLRRARRRWLARQAEKERQRAARRVG
jgi:hypothetical protein